MKTFKFTLPMLAVVLGLVALIGTAATEAEKLKSNEQGETFWFFEGGDPTDPSDYTDSGSQVPIQCDDENLELCGVTAPANGSQPDLSALQTDLDQNESQINYTNPDIYAGPRTQ